MMGGPSQQTARPLLTLRLNDASVWGGSRGDGRRRDTYRRPMCVWMEEAVEATAVAGDGKK